MAKTEDLLNSMEQILDLLIQNANELLDLSQKVFAEEELTRLQAQQNELLNQLIDKDEAVNKLPAGGPQLVPLRNRIDEKLTLFQDLNARFIDNITASNGPIQFEKGKAKKRTK